MMGGKALVDIFNELRLTGGVMYVIDNLSFYDIFCFTVVTIFTPQRYKPEISFRALYIVENYVAIVEDQTEIVTKNNLAAMVTQFHHRNQSLFF